MPTTYTNKGKMQKIIPFVNKIPTNLQNQLNTSSFLLCTTYSYPTYCCKFVTTMWSLCSCYTTTATLLVKKGDT